MQKGFGAIPLFIVVGFLLIGSFLFGIKYSETRNKTQPQTVINSQQEPITAKEPVRDLISICGEIPDKAYPNYEHFDVRKGPVWSPDCRHIAWSMWESGPGYEGSDPEVIKQTKNNPRKLSGREGIFLYKDSDKTVTKIYNPKELNETPEFIKWIDSQNLIFKVKDKEFNYNLITKETSPQN